MWWTTFILSKKVINNSGKDWIFHFNFGVLFFFRNIFNLKQSGKVNFSTQRKETLYIHLQINFFTFLFSNKPLTHLFPPISILEIWITNSSKKQRAPIVNVVTLTPSCESKPDFSKLQLCWRPGKHFSLASSTPGAPCSRTASINVHLGWFGLPPPEAGQIWDLFSVFVEMIVLVRTSVSPYTCNWLISGRNVTSLADLHWVLFPGLQSYLENWVL